jgi:tRNA pseudouridine38-40 synthase
MLGSEMAVKALARVDEQFSARFSARARHYRYCVNDAPVADPLARNAVWHVDGLLDVDAMNRAAAAFVGTHDFASLCRSQEGRTTERTVFSAGWTRNEHLIVFEVVARAFCHQMVRSMVALCVDVGRGKVDANSVPEIIAARDRNAGRGAAPPHGLVLELVDY